MKQMQYKGYLGSAEVSVEDGVVFGKILYIRDLVTYESSSPAELKYAFESAVDDYLADCISEGREPDRPFKGQFNVRIEPRLHRELAIAASHSDCSLNDYVGKVLSCHNHVDINGNLRPSTTEVTVVLQDYDKPILYASVVGNKPSTFVGHEGRPVRSKGVDFVARSEAWNSPSKFRLVQ